MGAWAGAARREGGGARKSDTSGVYCSRGREVWEAKVTSGRSARAVPLRRAYRTAPPTKGVHTHNREQACTSQHRTPGTHKAEMPAPSTVLGIPGTPLPCGAHHLHFMGTGPRHRAWVNAVKACSQGPPNHQRIRHHPRISPANTHTPPQHCCPIHCTTCTRKEEGAMRVCGVRGPDVCGASTTCALCVQ